MEENTEVNNDDLNFELIESEKIEPMFWDKEQIDMVCELYRINSPAGRIYFRFDANNEPVFYGGATSIGKEMPQDENLIKWIADTGYSEAKRYYYLRSLFGSMEHTMFAEMAIMGKVILDEIPMRVAEYFMKQNFHVTDKERRDMSLECQKDLISMAKWVIDHKIKFLAIELPVFSDHDGIATLIDIVARFTEEDKEYIALINYKSSKANSRLEHRFQLQTERDLFVATYPQFQNEEIRSYNLHASAWRKTNWTKKEGQRGRVAKPYVFSEQIDNFPMDRYNAYMELARDSREKKLNRPFTSITGELNLGDDVMNFINTKTIRELVMSGEWKKYSMSGNSVPETI